MELENIYGTDYDKSAFEKRLDRLYQRFTAEEHSTPDHVFSSSGRAEILGNHTDHNNGKVLVSAISCDILAVVKKTDNNVVKVCSEGYSPIIVKINDTDMRASEKGTSTALTRGVANAILSRGEKIGGFTAYLSSTVFKGAGVSSSASYEVLIAEIFNDLYLGGKLSAVEKAVISQYSENVYFGKPCGLLDQSGIAIGSLSKLDFLVPTSPTIEKADMIKGYSLVITNTGGDHASLTSHYALIRSEMESIANYFGKKVLREVDYLQFFDSIDKLKDKFSSRAIMRALHFFEENERVEKAFTALKENDGKSFLKQVNDSGLSSLNKLQNCAVPGDTNQPVILGIELSRRIIKDGAVRVHGGGFAGSILAIVNTEEAENYIWNMSRIFGKENVFLSNVRKEGTTRIK